MSTTITSTVLVATQPEFSDGERLALAGFLAGCRGMTRDAYVLDLRQFHRLVHRPRAASLRGPTGRHRGIRPPP